MTTTKQATVYQAHVAGFFGSFLSLDALRAWANDKRQQFNLTGAELVILQGTRRDDVDVFAPGCARKIITL